MGRFSATLALFINLLFFSGCAGMYVPNAVKPNYILDASGPLNAGLNPKTTSQVHDFATSYYVSQCKSSPIPSQANFVFEYYEKSNGRIKRKSEVIPCAQFGEMDEALAAKEMTKNGFDFMDSVCDAYFRRLGNQDQDLSFYTTTLNTISAAITAILGTTEADAKSIAIVSSVFALGEAGLEGFDETYHFAAELAAVEELVYRAMDSYENALWSQQSPRNFSDAKAAIQGYQRICQTSSIRSLVTQAVKAAKVEPVTTVARNRVVKNNPSVEQINSLYEDISVTSLTQSAFDWLIAGANGFVPKSKEPKLVRLLEQAGVTNPTSLYPKVRTWFSDLSTTEYLAYQNIVNRVDKLDSDTLPDVDATEDNARSAVIGNDPVDTGVDNIGRGLTIVPEVASR